MSADLNGTQKAVRSHPPAFDIRVDRVPIPKVEHPDDAIVKIRLAGLCGSDLHVFRGHEDVHEVLTCGHEFLGEVIALGESFKPGSDRRPPLYSSLKVGDTVIAPFTVSCGECHFCRIGFTCRCERNMLFGTPATPGGQAQYVRVPFAGGTLYNLSSIAKAASTMRGNINSIADTSLLLLCDNLPTGVFAAFQALSHPKFLPMSTGLPYPLSSLGASAESEALTLLPEDRALTIAVVGLGPVGMCASIALLDMLGARQLKYKVVAIEPVEARRKRMEAIFSIISKTEKGFGEYVVADIEIGKALVKEWTGGIGCNAVIEVVGNPSALTLAYDVVRPFGGIHSIGVHQEPMMPFQGRQLYDKNVSFDFGRCPVRAMLPMALDLLLRRQDIFGTVGGDGSLIEKVVSIDEAAKAYEEFNTGKCNKTIFDPWR
ncbi:hypothetical protein CONPUDRAFT_104507 [Coniophora puteana RWD-64-598 SS2]|uniref:Alcohol dehydrogenase n=1 Tax=Coniophora puteana (strain RWD-64-598) TaxID=741705 RepID=A0A5M3MQA1_CONPW|nr:uncharacterized protein CONPUDRAFT_104507 [Coniophora puteana RWD-64-598 SS2]EIW81237.1 hypothetical protein CONPUDRAFT_104507 [Coniophora puteana RWD-64-598 SS2]